MIFDAIRAWSERRQILRQIFAEQRVEKERDKARFAAILERLEAVMAADQYNTAKSIWQEIQTRFYSLAIQSPKLFKVLLTLHLYHDAERLMSDGLARYPTDQFYFVGQARVAQLAGDIALALERWAVVRKKFPNLAEAYAQTAACLVSADRIEEAEQMLAKGIRVSRDDVFCLIEYAKIAESRGNFDEALLRWQHLRDVQNEPGHPSYQNGTLGLAKCLRTMGRLDEAEAILQPFVGRFGVQEMPLMELARIAEAREDWDEAIRRWQRVKNSFPLMMEGYLRQIDNFKKVGRTDHIESVLCEVIERFPDALGPAQDYALIAQERGDPVEAAQRWLMVVQRFPDCEIAYFHGAKTLTAANRNEEAEALLAAWERRRQ